MRSAPPVSVRCSGGWPWRALVAGLPALAAGAVAAWGLGHAGRSPAPALAVVVLVAIVGWRVAVQRPAMLVWDGRQWTVDGDAVVVEVMIDSGFLMLLRCTTAGRSRRWIAVTAAEAGVAMHALRTAVYARPAAAVAPAATAE